MSLLIGDKLVVSMHYKLTDEEGNVLDNSEGKEPLSYMQGAGNIIPGLEKAMIGKVQGDSFKVKIEPAEGYGEVIPELIQTLEKSVFKGIEKIEPGMAFEAEAPDGAIQHILVTKVEGDKITIDANHPLAGAVLNFEVDIVGVREATKEELKHGHVH